MPKENALINILKDLVVKGKVMNILNNTIRIFPYGEGDDDGSLEDDFNEWKAKLWEELKKKVESGVIITSQTASNKPKSNHPFILLVNAASEEIDVEKYNPAGDGFEYEFQTKQYLSASNAKITLMKELRQKTDDGSTLHIEIDSGSSGLTYKTAENLAVYVENRPEDVEKAAKLLGLNLSDIITLQENKDLDKKAKLPFPTPISVKTFLTKFCDLVGPLR